MESLKDLRQRVIEHIAGLAAFEEAAVVSAYPENRRAFPLKTPVIAVETAGVTLSPAALGGFLGGDTPVYGTSALITLRFTIYAPVAEDCGLLFESLCDALFGGAFLGAQSVTCGVCLYDAKTAAFYLPAECTLKAAWNISAQHERLFTEIMLKEDYGY